MSDYIPDYVPDMNHDGEVTGMDAALFHEMLDEDDAEPQPAPARSQYNNSPDWIVGAFVKWMMILFMGGLVALLLFVIPLNMFTFFVSLFCISGIVRMLTL